jgi:hypothetical protein
MVFWRLNVKREVALKLNHTFGRTGCKSVTARKKSRGESALLVLGETPLPAFQLS